MSITETLAAVGAAIEARFAVVVAALNARIDDLAARVAALESSPPPDPDPDPDPPPDPPPSDPLVFVDQPNWVGVTFDGFTLAAETNRPATLTIEIGDGNGLIAGYETPVSLGGVATVDHFHDIGGLKEGTTYDVWVDAFAANGTHAYGERFSVATLAAPVPDPDPDPPPPDPDPDPPSGTGVNVALRTPSTAGLNGATDAVFETTQNISGTYENVEFRGGANIAGNTVLNNVNMSGRGADAGYVLSCRYGEHFTEINNSEIDGGVGGSAVIGGHGLDIYRSTIMGGRIGLMSVAIGNHHNRNRIRESVIARITGPEDQHGEAIFHWHDNPRDQWDVIEDSLVLGYFRGTTGAMFDQASGSGIYRRCVIAGGAYLSHSHAAFEDCRMIFDTYLYGVFSGESGTSIDNTRFIELAATGIPDGYFLDGDNKPRTSPLPVRAYPGDLLLDSSY